MVGAFLIITHFEPLLSHFSLGLVAHIPRAECAKVSLDTTFR
jgi:hypothetical protein